MVWKSVTMLRLKSCNHCNGDLYYDNSEDGWVWKCLQCSRESYGVTNTQTPLQKLPPEVCPQPCNQS